MAQVTGNQQGTYRPPNYSQLAAANPWRQAQPNPYAGGLANPAPRKQPEVPAWLTNYKLPTWLQPGQQNQQNPLAGQGGLANTMPRNNRPPAWLAFNQPYVSPVTGPMDLTTIVHPPDPNGPMPYIPQQQTSQPAWMNQSNNVPWQAGSTLPAWLQPSTPSTTPTTTGPAGQGGTPNPVNYPRTQDQPVVNYNVANPWAGGLANPVDFRQENFYPQLPSLADQGGYGGYYGFGSRYRGWGGGGGGGGARYSNLPAWYLGLNNWNFNE